MKVDQDKLIAHAQALSDKKLLLYIASRSQEELRVLACTELIDRLIKIRDTRKDLITLVEKFKARQFRESERKWYIKVHGAIVPGTENNIVPRVDMDKLKEES